MSSKKDKKTPKKINKDSKPSSARASGKKSNGTTPTGQRKSSTAFFPDGNASMKMMEKAVQDYELEIKKLKRENQVMASQLKKLQDTAGKKSKNIEKEKNMRVAANKERHWVYKYIYHIIS